jgi:undecaprenyl diphosphate synthase
MTIRQFFPGGKAKKRKLAARTDGGKPPRHLAIIMDGNGRWAKLRGLPRAAGHSAGAETFRRIAYYCRDLGLEYLTVYAFSTENWKRSEQEVSAIMRLLESYLREAIEKMEREGIRLNIMGDTDALSDSLRALITKTRDISESYRGFQVNLCVNYGGRDEILRAARRYAAAFAAGGAQELDEDAFAALLYSAGIPDPDL